MQLPKMLTHFQGIAYTLGTFFFMSLMVLVDNKAEQLPSKYNPMSLNITKTTTMKENYHFQNGKLAFKYILKIH